MITTLILFAVFCPSSSTPIPSPKPVWRRESCGHVDTSDARATQDIVWSCVATIFACVWVAIHPNLPDLSISAWSRFKQRTGIMILAIFAPEFILIWALRQRIGAGRIVKEYNRNVPKVVGDRKSLWTLTHGFYVQMGGFVLYNKETPLRVLHFRDMLELLRLGMVDHPTVTEEDICDRSKGDFLTKLLVVVQTTWFVIQCAARWAARLPVTELEIITLAFATLNIITYSLWWEKPQNVSIGVRVQLKEEEIHRRGSNKGEGYARDRDLGSLLFRRSTDSDESIDSREEMDVTDPSGWVRRNGGQDVGPEPFIGERVITNLRDMGGDQDTNTLATWPSTDGKGTADAEGGIVSAFDHDFTPVAPRMERTDISDGRCLSPHWDESPPESKMSSVYYQPTRVPIWRRTSTFVWKILRHLYNGILKSILYKLLREVVLGPTLPGTIFPPDTLNVGAFYAYGTLDRSIGLVFFAVASGVLFGGLHLIPWEFTFPTPTESFLWRISSLWITLNPVLLSIPLIFHSFISDQPGVVYRLPGRWTLKPLQLITMTVPLYILARVLIVVLAFVTLRSLPPGVYTEIPWSNFIPHI